jgi:hypothetical protein
VRASTGSARAALGKESRIPLALSLSKGALGACTAAGLAACSAGADGADAAGPGNTIECSLGGSNVFAADCEVERSRLDGALILTVRHPDGGFRRFEVLDGARGVKSADGAEPAQVNLRKDGMEVSVGADRYRFPAAMTGDDGE